MGAAGQQGAEGPEEREEGGREPTSSRQAPQAWESALLFPDTLALDNPPCGIVWDLALL